MKANTIRPPIGQLHSDETTSIDVADGCYIVKAAVSSVITQPWCSDSHSDDTAISEMAVIIMWVHAGVIVSAASLLYPALSIVSGPENWFVLNSTCSNEVRSNHIIIHRN